MAVAAVLTGTFDAAIDFVVSAVAGVAVGLAVGWAEVRVLQRLPDTTLDIFLTVGAAYGAQAVLIGEGDGMPPEDARLARYADLRRDLIAAERDALLQLRNDGRVRVDTVRQIERDRDLDLDEARLRA